jgi:hypothetical protein
MRRRALIDLDLSTRPPGITPGGFFCLSGKKIKNSAEPI